MADALARAEADSEGLPLADIAHALEQTTADSWVAVNRNGDVRLVVPKGNAYTLARPRPRTEETTP